MVSIGIERNRNEIMLAKESEEENNEMACGEMAAVALKIAESEIISNRRK
jgi:hypothetical protein